MHAKVLTATALIASGVIAISMLDASAITADATHEQAIKKTSNDSSRTAAIVDAGGNLHVPEDYRTTYQFLGSWAVAADQGQGPNQLHVVYASPGTTSRS